MRKYITVFILLTCLILVSWMQTKMKTPKIDPNITINDGLIQEAKKYSVFTVIYKNKKPQAKLTKIWKE